MMIQQVLIFSILEKIQELHLLSQELIEENFHSWKLGISIALSAKNKTVFITRVLKKHNDDDPLVNGLILCNDDMVLS